MPTSTYAVLAIYVAFGLLELFRTRLFSKNEQTRNDGIVEVVSTVLLLVFTQPAILIFVDYALGALRHLLRGATGEGEQQDARRVHAVQHQVCDAVRQRAAEADMQHRREIAKLHVDNYRAAVFGASGGIGAALVNALAADDEFVGHAILPAGEGDRREAAVQG